MSKKIWGTHTAAPGVISKLVSLGLGLELPSAMASSTLATTPLLVPKQQK